jgi:hypothetical protein
MVLRPTFAFLVSVMNFYYGSRRSAASTSTTPAATPAKDDFPEALTYRYNDNSAWVPAARTHEASSPFTLTLFLSKKQKQKQKSGTRANNHRFFFLFLGGRFRLAFWLFFWLFCLWRAGSDRPGQTRVPGAAERPARSHHVPHDGQVEHRVHHARGVAARRAAAAAVPRRGRADPGSRRRGGPAGRRRRRRRGAAAGVLPVHGGGVHDREGKGGGAEGRVVGEGSATATTTTTTTTNPR